MTYDIKFSHVVAALDGSEGTGACVWCKNEPLFQWFDNVPSTSCFLPRVRWFSGEKTTWSNDIPPSFSSSCAKLGGSKNFQWLLSWLLHKWLSVPTWAKPFSELKVVTDNLLFIYWRISTSHPVWSRSGNEAIFTYWLSMRAKVTQHTMWSSFSPAA